MPAIWAGRRPHKIVHAMDTRVDTRVDIWVDIRVRPVLVLRMLTLVRHLLLVSSELSSENRAEHCFVSTYH